jgi:polysaccharide chain length determinant protein (PEP-CTERM system associated)
MVQLLRAQLEEMKPKVEAQEQRLGRFQDDHLGELPEQTMANLATLDRLQTQLRITIDDRLRAMQRREEMQKRLSEAEPPSLADPEMLGARIARLNQELLDLRRRFSDRYPDVVRIQEEIAALESQAAEARNGRAPTTPADQYTQRLRDEVASAAAEIDRLKGQEARLRSEIVVYHKRLENAPRRQRALREVSRDHQSTRELYDSLLRQYEEAQLAASSVPDVRRPRFRVVDPAVPPTETAEPDRLKLALLGLVASLALAAAVVIVAEQRDDRFHSTADVRGFTRVPVLASIPRIVTESDARRRRMRFAAGAALAVLGVTLIIHAARYVAAGNDGLVTVLARGRS